MSFNICIIGAGDMGRHHASAWQARTDCNIVSIGEDDAPRRDSLASSTGAQGYSNYRDAIAHPNVHIVSICVPVCFHSEVAVFAAQTRRHILCEKPLALTLEQADA